jgi:hypothetical protein
LSPETPENGSAARPGVLIVIKTSMAAMKFRINLRVILLSLLNRSKRCIPPIVATRDLDEILFVEGCMLVEGGLLVGASL